ncbi:hypothetical protein PybrP1_003915 [[Pythium] brassicae (nom. inval.)]|nr:hypothetical protein PybrP1_003915 [[Pythium] brassicae (nom. inval.)]
MEWLNTLQPPREGRVEGLKMPTFSEKPSDSVDEFLFEIVDIGRVDLQGRIVDTIAANLRDMVVPLLRGHRRPIASVSEFQEALKEDFVLPDQQQRLQANLKKCRQTRGIDYTVARFRQIMALVREMSSLDKLDRFADGLKTDTRKEANY